jgi:hypothetical protein
MSKKLRNQPYASKWEEEEGKFSNTHPLCFKPKGYASGQERNGYYLIARAHTELRLAFTKSFVNSSQLSIPKAYENTARLTLLYSATSVTIALKESFQRNRELELKAGVRDLCNRYVH